MQWIPDAPGADGGIQCRGVRCTHHKLADRSYCNTRPRYLPIRRCPHPIPCSDPLYQIQKRSCVCENITWRYPRTAQLRGDYVLPQKINRCTGIRERARTLTVGEMTGCMQKYPGLGSCYSPVLCAVGRGLWCR